MLTIYAFIIIKCREHAFKLIMHVIDDYILLINVYLIPEGGTD